VAIHDAARPLVSSADVAAVLAGAREHGAAMLAAPSALPALEIAGTRVACAYPARELWRAQTPQAARAAWLLDAYERAAGEGFDGTDTAAVLSRAGYPVRIVAATADNPKLTVLADLRLAEALFKRT
jgi:2-C-methyl-D-erythritol 4-phosphate cytidylyltransferase